MAKLHHAGADLNGVCSEQNELSSVAAAFSRVKWSMDLDRFDVT